MSRISIKLVQAFGLALAITALSAPLAQADYYPPSNWNLPNGSTFSGDWQGVTVKKTTTGELCLDGETTCTFDSGAVDWSWEYPQHWSWVEECEGELEGQFRADGTVLESSATLDPSDPSEYSPFCQSNEATWRSEAPGSAEEMEDFWQGELCMHLPTGEVWLRQVMTFKSQLNGAIRGPWVTYGQVLGTEAEDGSLTASAFNFESAELPGTNGLTHTAEFPVGGSASIYPAVDPETEEAAPCDWYEMIFY